MSNEHDPPDQRRLVQDAFGAGVSAFSVGRLEPAPMDLDNQLTREDRQSTEQRARSIRQNLSLNPIDPIVVEFAGSPKSGKSTNIDIISHFFKRMEFKVWAPTEGVSKRTPYNLKSDWVAFNSWSLAYAIQELLVGYNNVDKHDLIILDRGPFDSLAWMGLLKHQGDLSEVDYDIIKNFALLEKWRATIQRIYLFTCTPEISLNRENQSKLTAKHGSAMNPETLTQLLSEYGELQSVLADYPAEMLDTSESDSPLQSAMPIARDICSLFENCLPTAR